MSGFDYQPPMTPYLTIVYRDDDIIVVDKQPWLLSVRGRGSAHQDSIQSRIGAVFPTSYIVHRLDLATSGVMVLAMHKDSSANLGRQFAERLTQKTYYARVLGHPTHDKGQCDEPLIVDWPNRPRQKVCYDTGKQALTHYQVVQRDNKTSLIELSPHTGRSHQLRVHMQQLGHPILGDRLYSHPDSRKGIERMHLHAGWLGLFHPRTNAWMTFASPHGFDEEPALDDEVNNNFLL